MKSETNRTKKKKKNKISGTVRNIEHGVSFHFSVEKSSELNTTAKECNNRLKVENSNSISNNYYLVHQNKKGLVETK